MTGTDMDPTGNSDGCANGRAVEESAAIGEAPLPKLLFAHAHTDRPSVALKSASAVAGSLGAELHVVSVLPRLRSLCIRQGVPYDSAEARRSIEECVATFRHTRAWCENTLGEPLALRRLRIRFGAPAEVIAEGAAELDAVLVVVAAVAQPLGPTAIGVARACSRPVLVARGLSVPGAVIAATDLQDVQYRVLRQASALGAALGSRVIAVHNVSCLSTPLGSCLDAGASPAPELPRRMLAELPAPVDLVVTTDLDPVRAIVEQAEHHRSGIIVVGARPRSSGRFEASVPSEVIERSRCSVLVTSLEP
jgi:nucleotide-binding universal stress UspA family protein